MRTIKEIAEERERLEQHLRMAKNRMDAATETVREEREKAMDLQRMILNLDWEHHQIVTQEAAAASSRRQYQMPPKPSETKTDGV